MGPKMPMGAGLDSQVMALVWAMLPFQQRGVLVLRTLLVLGHWNKGVTVRPNNSETIVFHIRLWTVFFYK